MLDQTIIKISKIIASRDQLFHQSEDLFVLPCNDCPGKFLKQAVIDNSQDLFGILIFNLETAERDDLVEESFCVP